MTDSKEDRETLVQLLKSRSIEIGDFVLSSGKRSKFYVDARTTTMSGLGLAVIGRLGLEVIQAAGWSVRGVGGLTLGADPVSYAIAMTARAEGNQIDAFTVRKSSKAHGTGKRIEGCFEPGMSVAIIEDVITTGGSALEAVEVVRREGGTVTGVLAVVDRGEGGRETIEQEGMEVRALVSLPELDLIPSATS